MDLDDALTTFVIESRELLDAMEDALLQIEHAPEDTDLINAIFRAAHTIKGSAGLFGLDHIVTFTHHAENVLDKARSGQLPIDSNFVALFLDVRDQLSALIAQVAEDDESAEDTFARSQELIARLKALGGTGESAASQAGVPMAPEPAVTREGGPGEGVETDNWHLSLRFGPDILRQGLDPLAFLRYLTTFGRIVFIVTHTHGVPAAAAMDPEACYLGFDLSFQTDADKATIESAFEFVRDDARIRILPPHSKIDEYRDLIDSLPDDDMRLGEILVRCGTLSPAELDAALKTQAAQRERGQPAPAIGEVLVAQHVVRPAVVEAALHKQKQVQDTQDGKDPKGGEAGLLRVNADTLDAHINLIGELIIASAGIALAAQKSGQPELLEAASVLNRLVENVRDSALQLRMVQIGATFNRFQRVVRDVSAELGKDIRLEISGAETELDKTVVEKIGDPLTHLVRNAIDHGIEAAELRRARGKPAQGTVRLNAYHDSGSIVIEVVDDGGGLRRERIVNKALERGLIKADQPLSDQEIYNLIFEPGFSTVEQVSNLSGRGVGMDVVRRNIAALRGSVDIDSTEGVGTTMRIRLPLTLAIIDGFLVGVNDAAFVVPLEMVVECVELSAADAHAAHGCDHLNLRGEVLPFIRLKDLFEVPAAAGAPAEVAGRAQPARRENVVVVQYAGRRAGLVVDHLMGEFQTVIRPLGAVFAGLEGLSGFTILGSGAVALILDVPGLVRRVAAREHRRNAKAASHLSIE